MTGGVTPFWTMQGLIDDERLEKRLPDRSVTRMWRMRRENLWTLRECKILGKGSSSHSDGRRKFLLDASIMYKGLTQKLFVQGVFTQLASSYWACILEQQKVFFVFFFYIKSSTPAGLARDTKMTNVQSCKKWSITKWLFRFFSVVVLFLGI